MKRVLSLAAFLIVANSYAGVTEGLVGYYPFDGNAKDISGYSNDLSVTGAILAPDRFGRTNAAYYFNGSTAWMISQKQLPISNSMPRSLSVWVRNENSAGYVGWPDIIGFGAVLHTGDLFDMRFIPTGRRLYLHSHYQSSTSVTNAYSDGSWLQLVMTTAGTVDTLRMYVNGVQIQSRADYSQTAAYATTPGKLRLSTWTEAGGISHDPTNGWTEGFKGWMDDARVYNCALTPQEVSELYQLEAPPILFIETAAVRLRFGTLPNFVYNLDWSYDFQTWSNLTSILGSGQETNFVDWVDGTRRFYRLTITP